MKFDSEVNKERMLKINNIVENEAMNSSEISALIGMHRKSTCVYLRFMESIKWLSSEVVGQFKFYKSTGLIHLEIDITKEIKEHVNRDIDTPCRKYPALPVARDYMVAMLFGQAERRA